MWNFTALGTLCIKIGGLLEMVLSTLCDHERKRRKRVFVLIMDMTFIGTPNIVQ